MLGWGTSLELKGYKAVGFRAQGLGIKELCGIDYREPNFEDVGEIPRYMQGGKVG